MWLIPWKKQNNNNNNNNNTASNHALMYLNVYDLTPVNNYMYWFGLGIFHSGIEAHGMEYAFGAHEYSSSGIFEVEPRSCPGFVFRRSIRLGSTDMSSTEFRSFMEHLSNKYHGDTYHLIAKNCNHFTDEVSYRLTGNPIPRWVNRLAKLGSLCNCLLSEKIQVGAVGRITEHATYSGDQGSESGYSSLTMLSDDEEEDNDRHGHDHDHLLTVRSAPNMDVAFLQDNQ
ncbi:deSI-like protein At4g17486 [Bidens hawaiensis]|uniref:deSI-like protein At4g17486 n=1 Tax=Bidens hawaiensis TaxID=980011 RepID=UPI00404A3EA0